MDHPQRLDYHSLAPKAARALSQLSHGAFSSDRRLKELVNLRISQINGCAFCVDMHWADLIKQGVDPRHVNAVSVWREARRFISERDQAALNWAEAANALPSRAPTDDDFAAMKQHFTDAEIAELTFSVAAIRSWNLLAISFHTPVPETPYENA